jgi:hypothetical protein
MGRCASSRNRPGTGPPGSSSSRNSGQIAEETELGRNEKHALDDRVGV